MTSRQPETSVRVPSRASAGCRASAGWRAAGRARRLAARLLPLPLAAVLVFAGGCEPAEPQLVSPLPAPDFEVAGTNLRGDVLPEGEVLEVRFTRQLDTGSARSNAVRLRRASGRRVRRLRAWAEGDTLFIEPAPGRSFPRTDDLVLKLRGRPSPRGLRSAAGEPLTRSEEIVFRMGAPRRVDLTGPRLVSSWPANDEEDVRPGRPLELHMSEALARGSVRRGDAVELTVDGERMPARLRLSADHTVVVVRPRRPLPARARVEVRVLGALLDRKGNPAFEATVAFRTSPRRLRRLVEEFVDVESADPAGTTSAWADALSPGHLVARPGRVVWRAAGAAAAGARTDIGPRHTVRFQVLVPADDSDGVTASALRLRLRGALDGAHLLRAEVLAGATDLGSLDPTFAGNLAAAEAIAVAHIDRPVALDGDAGGEVEIAFDTPLQLAGRLGVLLDVTLETTPGVRIAAIDGGFGTARIEGRADDGLVPDIELLVVGGNPRALSTWFDSGAVHPTWGTAIVDAWTEPGAPEVFVEFQSAAAGPRGAPDLARSSEWERRLEDLPALRFVRFRVRFAGLGAGQAPPSVDRIVIPFEY